MQLEVLIGEALVGRLSHDSDANQFAFAYSVDWLASLGTFPLAPSLPLVAPAEQTAEAHGKAVRVFFENLLPEGQALDDVASAYSVSKHSLTGLLAILGRETAGALRILSPVAKTAAEPDLEAVLRPVSRAELSERIRQRAQMPFSIWDRKVRLSIAGYQDKLAVFQDGQEQWFLVDGDTLASTHILKPEPVNAHLAGLTSNEFFCMRLAGAMGLPVAPVRLHHVPEPVLLIQRFDREVIGDVVRRIPVIDGCQALGLSVGAKYERPYGDARDVREIRSGASLPKLFGMLASTARPVAERQALLRWTIFQVLIGNTDAHAKNLTFFSGPGGLSLAPAYDLVCSLIYAEGQVEDAYAFAIGDAFTAGELSAYEWGAFCVATGMRPELVKKELGKLSALALKVLPKVVAEVLAEGANPEVLARIEAQVSAESRRQIGMAQGIPKMAELAR